MSKVVKIAAALAVCVSTAASATPVELMVNGGFETGSLSGWTTTGLGSPTGTCPSSGRDWNVSTNGSATGCSAVGNPIEGSNAAYVMNDAGGTNPAVPATYRLSQTIVVPVAVSAATLTFKYTSVSSYSGDTRRFFVDVLDGSGTFIGELFSYIVPFTDGNAGWDTVAVNLDTLLGARGGESLTFRFNSAITQSWTGPAGLGLDAVSLTATANAVPEPTSLALLALALLGAGGATARARQRRA